MKIIVTMICSVLTAILAMYIGMQIQKNNMEFELKKQESAYQEKIQEAQKLAEEKIQQQKLFHQILRLMLTNELFQLTKDVRLLKLVIIVQQVI